jgi:hypothetical protein
MPKQPDKLTRQFLEEWVEKAEVDIRLAEYLLAENTILGMPSLFIVSKAPKNI